MTLGVLVVHGFHPWAEDGGLYATGVELILQPRLFPADRAFVTAPLHYSLFAPLAAAIVRWSQASLATVLLCLYLSTTALMLFASRRIARLCFPGQSSAQWTAVGLLAAWWTLPVAGTSLLLMDPYLTARSFSTPLTLLAVAEALQWPIRSSQPQQNGRGKQEHASRLGPGMRCGAWLILAATLHPLMAIYAVALVLVICLRRQRAAGWIYALLVSVAGGVAWALQAFGPRDSSAAAAAVFSRYYWFLSQWQWYEWLGLLGPLLVLSALLRFFRADQPRRTACLQLLRQPEPAFRTLCVAGIVSGLLAAVVSLLFSQERYSSHAVARLQPLRAFLPIYALLPLLLGGALAEALTLLAQRRGSLRDLRAARAVLCTCIAALAFVMFSVQRATFPASPDVEWPGRANPNSWVQAFAWVREHTPADALFALDARYINVPGEDAQSFRAIALRSAVPDYSKDGGEAANFSQLAPTWLRSAEATADLSQWTDQQRRTRLGGFGVRWLVLQRSAVTSLPCPYRNEAVLVCRF